MLILAAVIVYPLTPTTSARLGDSPPTLDPTDPPLVKVRRGSQTLSTVIAVVSDDLTPAGDITVTALSTPTGVTITNIVNTNGTITADLEATCTGPNGNQDALLEASDGVLTTSAILEIVVQGNAAPTLGAYGITTVTVGDDVDITPSAPPSDAGSVEDVTVEVTSPAGFTGMISIDPVTGVVSVTDAGPVNTYTITVTATDNCGTTSTTTFTLDVQAPGNTPPVADAGPDQGATSCSRVNLTAAGSTDADGNPLTYSWIQTGGTPVILRNSSSVTPFFEAPNVATMDDLTFQVTVSDSIASNSDSVTVTVTHVNDVHVDTVGVFLTGARNFFLHNCNGPGLADSTFTFGSAGVVPLAGDWDGDGDDSIGVYTGPTGCFFLKFDNGSGMADIDFCYGPDNSVPLVGDWDGDGITTIGVYLPATSEFLLKNTNESGAADTVFRFGAMNSGAIPVVGDWDGDGDTTIGLYQPATSTFFIKNTNEGGAADDNFRFGGVNPTNNVPIVGNWDGIGGDSVGIYVRDTGTFFLSNDNEAGPADIKFRFGTGMNLYTPVVGNWDGL